MFEGINNIEYAKVPVFRFVQAGIGEGVLGGNIVSHRKLIFLKI